MFHRLVFTIATAVSLTGLYALYTLATRPFVVIPIVPEQTFESPEVSEVGLPPENVRVANRYLPRLEWVANAQHMLRLDHAFVFTNDWKPDEENNKQIQFSPFAMIWLRTDQAGNEEAVSLTSESAQLEFAQSLDLKSSTPGRVVRAIAQRPSGYRRSEWT